MSAPLHSALYEGTLHHQRYGKVPHAFRRGLFMMYLDLAELPALFDPYALWSARRPAPAWFRRADHLGPAGVPLDVAVRALVEERSGKRPAGPVRVLTHLRYLGHVFNPLSVFYCFEPDGEHIAAIVAEVHNTPWGERHRYVLSEPLADGDALRYRFRKAFHVSPFLPMALDYNWRFAVPGPRLSVHIRCENEGERIFDATLSLRRQEIGRRTLGAALVRHPLITVQVVASIYWQAARLVWKGAPFHPHPARGGGR